jgi:hypothetical protein
VVSNTGYWVGKDVTIARAETSRVRAFGRNWNFEGARPSSCGSTGAADAGEGAPKAEFARGARLRRPYLHRVRRGIGPARAARRGRVD